VLLSSAGRRAGLLACFRADATALGLSLRVVAVDLDPDLSAACRLADAAYPVAACHTPRYLEQLYDICRRERVDLVVPTIDPELYPLSGAAEDFAGIGTRIVVSSPGVVATARSKQETARRLREAGIPTPRTRPLADVRDDPGGLTWPLLAKPDAGSSSVGIRWLDTPGDLAGLPTHDGYIVQERWFGTEFTVNLFVDAGGTFRCAVPHERREVRAGEVSKGITRRHPALEAAARRLAEALPGLRGPACFQAIARDDGAFAVFELNARLGGGYPLAHAAGAPFTRWLLEEAAGLPSSAHNDWEDGLLMLRHDEARFYRLPLLP
jgi:carbamoyl-phosphate synthase large subunit